MLKAASRASNGITASVGRNASSEKPAWITERLRAVGPRGARTGCWICLRVSIAEVLDVGIEDRRDLIAHPAPRYDSSGPARLPAGS